MEPSARARVLRPPHNPGEPGRLPVTALVTGDRVWSAGQTATVGAVTHRGDTDRPIVVELWHVGATAPEVMRAAPGHTVQVDTLVQVDDE